MNRIELNHWFAEENKLSISLFRYYVDITICQNDMFIYYKLKVIDDDRNTIVLNFYSLEDAIVFTEKTVDKCINLKEIAESYKAQNIKSLKKINKI